MTTAPPADSEAGPRRRRPGTSAYRIPDPLRDLRVIDLLELTGNQLQAGQALQVHQSTVCRIRKTWIEQFGIVRTAGVEPGQRPPLTGMGLCIQHLRMAARAHRMEEGWLRLATDALHQPLVDGMEATILVPPRFRSSRHWAELVRLGVIDAALVSSLCHDQWLEPGGRPSWPGVRMLPLGELTLGLASRTGRARQVLVPHRLSTPLLHLQLQERKLALMTAPRSCQEQEDWLHSVAGSSRALLLCRQLAGAGPMRDLGLRWHRDAPPLMEQLWLLLPAGQPHVLTPTVRAAEKRLKRRLQWLRRRLSD
ncbi:hypothetical protein [Synechococcus sp. CCY 9618]|uniref:hypothetical protein n=1 Tax=Synechococcus sp. CCY 9618 TaxID=2815602 RepID=UPI001C23A33F|nr:hypothetical protein [Synechococcus sp. CCY 9618]